jgi:hypothetical protein
VPKIKELQPLSGNFKRTLYHSSGRLPEQNNYRIHIFVKLIFLCEETNLERGRGMN